MKSSTSVDCADALDFDFDDVPDTTSSLSVSNNSNSKRKLKGRKAERSSRAKVTTIVSNSEAFRLAELKNQDPAVFAHLLADHFVAKEVLESSTAAAAPPSPAKRQVTRPAAGTVSLGNFKSWQFGERCLATYRVLFGRPLWAATPSSLPSMSPRPRKRKHLTPPTSSSSDTSENSQVDQEEVDALELETDVTEELLSLPTFDELLELQSDDMQLPGEEVMMEEALHADDVLAGLTMELDDGLDVTTGADAVDLLWDLDAAAVDGVDTGLLLTEGEEEELRFLASSPHCFAVGSPDIEDMDIV